MSLQHLSVVDLFAGAGGLSEGFHKHDFNIIASVEKDKYASETLLTRHIYWALKRNNLFDLYERYLTQDVSKEELMQYLPFNPVINAEISDISLPSIIEQIKENMKKMDIESPDIFIGGPPCQAYSLIGRAVDKYKMEKDPRNRLYQYYVNLLEIFKPRMFVFENVPGILSAGKGKLWEDVRYFFSRAGYEIDYNILDAANFGVLQSRKRVILMGWKKTLKLVYPEYNKSNSGFLVRDILKDLPPVSPGQAMKIGSYSAPPSEYLKKSIIRKENDILIDHVARPINNNDREIYKFAIEMWKTQKSRLKYNDLPNHLKTRADRTCFLDCYKVLADDLPVSHTMIAHISKDGHYYIHPDSSQLRSITVREAARIQSFPDDYKFEGPRSAQFTQIGNAVPPLMSKAIAEKVKEMLI